MPIRALSHAIRLFLIISVIFIVMAPECSAEDPAAASGSPEPPGGALTLTEALALALERNPDLAAYSWDIRAAEARQIQAQLRPNPELAFEIEDIRLGNGPGVKTTEQTYGLSPSGFSMDRTRGDECGSDGGLSEAQFTISLSQVLELGGKRAHRMRLAERDRDVAAWDYEIARADVLKNVAIAFIKVLIAQERLTLDNDLSQLAEQVSRTVAARVKAGRVTPLESAKAETALSMARVQGIRAKGDLESARVRLVALWGEKEAGFERTEGDLDTIREAPMLDDLFIRVEKNPDLSRWRAEIGKRRSAISVEKSKAKSDLTINAGFKMAGSPDSEGESYSFGSDGLSRTKTRNQSEDEWDNTAVIGFSIPLPLFDRNQGSIKESEHLAAKASEESRAVKARIHADLAKSYHNLSAAYSTLISLDKEVLPAADQTFASINEAYRQGKFGYLDVMDAQRTLFEARHLYLDALGEYHESVAELERMIGESLWSCDASPSSSEEVK